MLDLVMILHRRYKTLEDIKKDIEKYTDKKVDRIFLSESERIEGSDFMIDFEFDDSFEIYTIYYLKDNAGQFYITEI